MWIKCNSSKCGHSRFGTYTLKVALIHTPTFILTSINSMISFFNRAMAVCISLMMGRLGSTVGSNVVGLLLDNYCHLAFILSGSLLIRK